MTEVLGPDTVIADLVRTLREGATVRVVPAGIDKPETLARFGEALAFPDWYGLNYDAMFDCLLQWAHAVDGPAHVVWDGTAPLREEAPEVYAMVVRILGDAEDEGSDFRATVVDR